MADPWLSIIGIGEDGLDGLSVASRKALEAAEIIFGGPRHLTLANADGRGREWPVPFSVDPVLALRGQRVAVLASGDPFWFGAGGSLMAHLEPGEFASYPVPSTFSHAANRLGWRLEETRCFGLHAAPFERLLPVLTKGQRVICLLRDGAAPAELAAWLAERGAGASVLHIMERLGGGAERLRQVQANGFDINDISAPVAIGIEVAKTVGLPNCPGLPDDVFAHDGQITKCAIRALTLAALAPHPGEVLWDIGAGSGSVSVEWCLAGGRAVALEAKAPRVANIARNIASFGLSDRMQVVEGQVVEGVLPAAFAAITRPDAVFIGGGGNAALLNTLFATLPTGTRLVMNAVTLETEMLLADWQSHKGGDLLRIELAKSAPLGQMRGWAPARPVVQWSVVL